MALDEERGRTHWNSIAHCWHLYSSPLRPCAEDMRVYYRFAQAYSPDPALGASAALILGVTPEIATMPWPRRTIVTGADRSQEMVNLIWPGNRPGLRQAQCIDWFELPAPAEPYDLVIGDGSLNTLRYPEDLRRLLAKLRSLTRPGALLITRSFAHLAGRESLAALAEAARAGVAGGFHAFKFRLAMALQPSPEEGVPLDDIWHSWHRIDSTIPGVSESNGWSAEVVGTIDLFRGKQVRLSFPTIDELIATLEAEGMSLLDRHLPTYEMGDRCPIMAWRF